MDNKLTFFRLGSLPVQHILHELSKNGVNNVDYEIIKKTKNEAENCISPGQFIKHYSPNIPSFLLNNQSNNKIS